MIPKPPKKRSGQRQGARKEAQELLQLLPFAKPVRHRDPAAIDRAREGRCAVCGAKWKLAVHHIDSRGAGGPDSDENLVELCALCHAKAHSGQISKAELRRLALQRIERQRGDGP